MCKLSIVIPIYRVEDYLPACLDSVLYPDLEGYEIIAVDDGSPDRSGQIAEDYARRFPGLIRVIHQENKGLGGARNTGIEAARGEFLLFLDSDDCLEPGAVREMLAALEQDADILIFDYVTVAEDGRVLARHHGCEREGAFRLSEYPGLFLELPSACDKLWRRSLFLDSGVRFPEHLWFEDLATSPRLYLRAGTIRSIRSSWLRYLQRGGSITHDRDPSRNREIITAIGLVLEDARRQPNPETYEKELEILAVKHQLLAATVRVNLADPASPLQGELLRDLEEKFPRWQENPYLAALPAQHKLLLKLMKRRQYRAVHTLMTLNDLVKRRKL